MPKYRIEALKREIHTLTVEAHDMDQAFSVAYSDLKSGKAKSEASDPDWQLDSIEVIEGGL